MNKWRDLFNFILGLVIFIIGGYLIFQFLRMIYITVGLLKTLSNPIIVALITGVVTILGSVISITVGKYYERKLLVEQEMREKKIPIYETLLEFSFKLFLGEKIDEEKMSEAELTKKLMQFTEQSIIWGSDEVISAWSNFRNQALERNKSEHGISGQEFMNSFAKVLLAIRKDIGHKNKNINENILLGLFINDLEKDNKNI